MNRTISRVLSLAALALLGACAASNTSSRQTTAAGGVTLRLGYFPNITHATALVGVGKGIFAEKLGVGVKLQPATFNGGGEAIEALFADAIEAAYVGPNPAINGYAKSEGKALRIISGATSGGAYLVVRPGITKPSQLKGTMLATPQLGGTPQT